MDDISLEPRWQSWLTDHNRRMSWIVLTLIVVFYPLFGILDYLVAPREWLWLLYGSRVVVTACTIAMFFLVRKPLFDRHGIVITSSYMTLVGLGIGVMVFVMGGHASAYTPGLILVSITAGTLFLWPPRVAFVTHSLLLGMFLLPNIANFEMERLQTGIINFFFLGTAIVVMIASQSLAYRSRRAQLADQINLETTTANLQQAHDELERLDKFKSQFFANITHELKTPLAMMLASLELMAGEDMGPLVDQQRATIESMFHNGLKLLRMIGDILDLSKLDESKVRLRIAERDLVAYLDGLVLQVSALTTRKGVSLELRCELDQCPIWYDSERMERVFVNLLSNAAKFTPEDGEIVVTLEDRGETVLVSVIDNGPGFPEDKAEALFGRFFQVDMGATRQYGGSGIGLSLAKEFVQLHGGRIWAESPPGEGARFFVELHKGRDHFDPSVLDRRAARKDVLGGRRSSDQGLAEWTGLLSERDDYRLLQIADATERRVVARHPHQEKRRHAILVVDDTPDILRVVHLTLHDQFQVFTARDGLEGLAVAREVKPSLIITDLMMPGIDGHELIRRLRADPATKQTPIIMLSARGETSDRVAGLETGANSYLAKPFSTRELRGAVHALLEMQDLQAEVQLEHRMDALETLAAGLAHEFNNALNQIRPAMSMVDKDSRSLRGLVTELVEQPTPTQLERMAKLCDRIVRLHERAATGAERIAHTVTLMGHYASEGHERKPQPHDVYHSMREVIDIVRPPMGHEVEIKTSFQGSGVVPCVPEEIHQVLTNLLSNAYDAVPETGGVVEVDGRLVGTRLILSVADNGPGVPEAIRERVFHPFFTTKEPGRGTGLGLNISWRIAQRHGGTLELIRGPLPGACFELTLPTRPPVQPPAPTVQPASAADELRDESSP
jgi:signal transduction histidine kinase